MPPPRQAATAVRPAQRRRTRAALLAAAVKMVRDGHALPSVAEVAATADISRRTAYRYFPTAEQLATEAVLETLAPQLDDVRPEAHGETEDDVLVRVAATVRRMQEAAVANERLLRTMIRLTIDAPPRADGQRSAAARGTRRVRWLEEAIAPLRRRLGSRAFEQLLSALCLCVGAESFIALRDVRGLTSDEAIEVSLWTATALVKAATDQPPTAARTRPRATASRTSNPTRRRGRSSP